MTTNNFQIMIDIRQSVIYAAKDFVKGKFVSKISMSSTVISEMHTINIVECILDKDGMPKEGVYISINRLNGEINITKDMLLMSDQTIFFWIMWAVLITADEEKDIYAADKNALCFMMKEYEAPYSDFILEFANLISEQSDDISKSRIDVLMKLLRSLKK